MSDTEIHTLFCVCYWLCSYKSAMFIAAVQFEIYTKYEPHFVTSLGALLWKAYFTSPGKLTSCSGIVLNSTIKSIVL